MSFVADDEGGETAIDPVSDPESNGIPLVPKPIVVVSQLVFASQAESAGAIVRRRDLDVDALAEPEGRRARQRNPDTHKFVANPGNPGKP